jgi:hypothetical protein
VKQAGNDEVCHGRTSDVRSVAGRARRVQRYIFL